MKLHFSNLQKLHSHGEFLQKSCWLENFFVVWWAVRDLLLGHKITVDDIDITMSGEPNTLWEIIKQHTKKQGDTINKEIQWTDKVDIFRTEKYGTMSILRHISDTDQDVTSTIKYEITPFREESWYADNRHPDEIVWSHDLLLDASRRDFTINCLYYSSVSISDNDGSNTKKSVNHKQKEGSKNDEDSEIDDILYTLKKQWYIKVQSTLIIQDNQIISLLLPKGNFDKNVFNSWYLWTQLSWEIDGIVWDPYQGISDIIDGKIKCVGNPIHRFTEDALRIMRALRFQNTLNFEPKLNAEFDFEKETWIGMKKHYFLIKNLSKERIHEEIKKVFWWPNPFWYVALLDELNILKYIFPHIMDIKYLNQPVRFHPFDVYSHTLLALHHLQGINSNYLVRIAMLYHDVGKSEQYYTHSFGLWTEDRSFIYGWWLNHINCGQDIAREDLSNIWLSNKEIDEVVWYIWYHMKPGEILMSKKEHWKKKMRELYTDGGYQKVCNLLDICRGDRRGHFNPIQQSNLKDVDQLQVILDNLKESEGQFTLDKLAINGHTLMTELHIPPSKKIGQLLTAAFDRVAENIKERNNPSTIMRWLKKYTHKK